jgi:hypothetical protein
MLTFFSYWIVHYWIVHLKTAKVPNFMFSIFFVCLAVLGFELRAYTLTHSNNSFCVRYFHDRVLWTICPDWLWTSILLISASWVARITGVSHRAQPNPTSWQEEWLLQNMDGQSYGRHLHWRTTSWSGSEQKDLSGWTLGELLPASSVEESWCSHSKRKENDSGVRCKKPRRANKSVNMRIFQISPWYAGQHRLWKECAE